MEEKDRERWVSDLKEPVYIQKKFQFDDDSLAQFELEQMKNL